MKGEDDRMLGGREAHERIRELESALASQTRRAQEAASALAALQASTSWRITAPLRALKRMLAALRRVAAGRHRMRLEPVHDLVRDGDAYRSTGNDPQFLLHAPKGRLPTGWCAVTCRAQAAGAVPLSFELYVDGGEGCSEATKTKLGPGQGASVLVRLPDHVALLRLDPMDCPGAFTLAAVEIREISKLEVFARMLRPFVRRALADPRAALQRVRTTATLLRAEGLEAMKVRVWSAVRRELLEEQWAAGFVALTEGERHAIRRQIEQFGHRPVISVIMPVYNTPEKLLRAAIGSVRQQLYPHWELCIADDASSAPHVRRVLEEAAAADPRVKVVFRESNGHISRASNSALALATGEFIALVDHDDEIAPSAFYEFARLLNDDPQLDMIYSDEDKIDLQGRHHGFFFKPGWSPDYLESCMYTCHLSIYRRSIVERVGGFRPEFDGAQDYDLVLRFTEQTDRVAHVDEILYHWRALLGSTAYGIDEKDYALDAGRRALQGRLERTGRRGAVRPSAFKGCFDIIAPPQRAPLVSIVMPTAGRTISVAGRPTDLAANCVRSIHATSTYRNFEIVAIDNGDLAAPTRQALLDAGCRLVTYTEPKFNIAKKINLGARHATGEYLILLNDDIEVITPEWIERLLEQALKPGVGVVGAKLLFADGRVQHAGVAHCNGLPDHVRRGYPRDDPGYFFSTASVRNFLGVTGACVLTPAAVFWSVGGFDESFLVNYNDIDYCLKVREKGLRTVYTPHAELYHFENASRLPEVPMDERQRYLAKWSRITLNDPYYNERRLNAAPPDYSFRFIGMRRRAA